MAIQSVLFIRLHLASGFLSLKMEQIDSIGGGGRSAGTFRKVVYRLRLKNATRQNRFFARFLIVTIVYAQF